LVCDLGVVKPSVIAMRSAVKPHMQEIVLVRSNISSIAVSSNFLITLPRLDEKDLGRKTNLKQNFEKDYLLQTIVILLSFSIGCRKRAGR